VGRKDHLGRGNIIELGGEKPRGGSSKGGKTFFPWMGWGTF